MKVKLNSISTDLDFSQVSERQFVSPTLMAKTTFGAWAPGAVTLESGTDMTKKGIRTITIAVKVPVLDFDQNSAVLANNTIGVTGDNTGTGRYKYVQARLTVTLPNQAPLYLQRPASGAVPPNQSSANAVAVAQAIETLIVCVAKQGSEEYPVLVMGESLFSGESLTGANPLYLGAMGAIPLGSSNREVAAQTSI